MRKLLAAGFDVQTTGAVGKAPKNTYLRLFRGVQALPVTPIQLQLVAQLLYIAFDRIQWPRFSQSGAIRFDKTRQGS